MREDPRFYELRSILRENIEQIKLLPDDIATKSSAEFEKSLRELMRDYESKFVEINRKSDLEVKKAGGQLLASFTLGILATYFSDYPSIPVALSSFGAVTIKDVYKKMKERRINLEVHRNSPVSLLLKIKK